MINVFDKNKNVSYFDTINEYMNYLENAKPYDDSRNDSSVSSSASWSGTSSFNVAMKLCKYGDEQLCSDIHKLSLSVNCDDTIDKIKRQYTTDIIGFTPHVPNYIMGIPNNMIRDTSIKIKSKIINVYINLSAHCGIDSDTIKREASKYVAAIDKLEEQGYRCNVYCGNMASKYGAKYGIIVKIKSDREPLNLMKMAFPMAHPSMLRRLSFKWIESIPIDFTHDGYGTPIDDDSTIKKLLSCIFNDTQFVVLSIGENNGNVNNVMDILKKKGMVEND